MLLRRPIMTDQKNANGEPQKSPEPPPKPPQPIASEHKTPTPGQAHPTGNQPKPAWPPRSTKN
jgi:hypothetical protein